MKCNLLFWICLLFVSASTAFGQKDPAGDKIELIQANELEGGVYKNQPVRILRGKVIFKQNDALMYCDSAFQYTKKNAIEAFGNVRINQGDTINLTGNRLTYNGDTRMAQVKENVVLVDPQMTLKTNQLDYNLKNKEAYYTNKGTIVDGNTVLTSKQGYYNTASKMFRFRRDVVVDNREENFLLESDTLLYSTITKVATFEGPTKITSEDGILHANKGRYNTLTAVYDFEDRASVKKDKYKILGDKIHYDEKANVTVIDKNVTLLAPEDSIIIDGDHARHYGAKGMAKVFGNVLLKQYSNGDTLYLTADTLISIEDKANPANKKLFAYPNARIFKSDMQAKTDSLIYNFSDSTIYFYHEPILWSSQNQIIGDSINIQMVNNNPYKMNIYQNSFIVSEDTLKNFNQIKGRDMVAYFKESKISHVTINGNAESLYFALEDEIKLIGMNKALCSDMLIKFSDNKVKTISFMAKPEASFIPPHEILEPNRILKGFDWRISERPTKESLLGTIK